MRLALNFRRVDPSKGGAETYLVDLCRRLIHAGHDVDLFANAWKEGALPSAVGLHRVEARGLARWQQTWDFARNSEAALRGDASRYDCTVGFINTWHQDVIIPQGGVHGGSLDAERQTVPGRLATAGCTGSASGATPRRGSTGRSRRGNTTRRGGRGSSRSRGWSAATWSGTTASPTTGSTSSPTPSTPDAWRWPTPGSPVPRLPCASMG